MFDKYLRVISDSEDSESELDSDCELVFNTCDSRVHNGKDSNKTIGETQEVSDSDDDSEYSSSDEEERADGNGIVLILTPIEDMANEVNTCDSNTKTNTMADNDSSKVRRFRSVATRESFEDDVNHKVSTSGPIPKSIVPTKEQIDDYYKGFFDMNSSLSNRFHQRRGAIPTTDPRLNPPNYENNVRNRNEAEVSVRSELRPNLWNNRRYMRFSKNTYQTNTIRNRHHE